MTEIDRMPTGLATNGPFPTRFDYCPWLFWNEATAELRKAQMDFQRALTGNGQFACGERCYISPLDRKSFGWGKSVVRGGLLPIKKKTINMCS